MESRDLDAGDPANKSIEILTLREGRYDLHCAAEIQGKLTSLLLQGLDCDLKEIQCRLVLSELLGVLPGGHMLIIGRYANQAFTAPCRLAGRPEREPRSRRGAYMADVDRTMLRKNLKLTPAQRLVTHEAGSEVVGPREPRHRHLNHVARSHDHATAELGGQLPAFAQFMPADS